MDHVQTLIDEITQAEVQAKARVIRDELAGRSVGATDRDRGRREAVSARQQVLSRWWHDAKAEFE